MASLQGLTCTARDAYPRTLGLANPGPEAALPSAEAQPGESGSCLAVDPAKPERGGQCFITRVLANLVSWLEMEGEDDYYDEEGKVAFTVSTAAATVNVGCYGDESVSDLLARMAQVAGEAEQASLGTATLHVQTASGEQLCADTRLADLAPAQEIILSEALSEAAVAKISDEKIRSRSSDSTRSTESLGGDDVEVISPRRAHGPSFSFVDEPHLGPSLLVRDGSGQTPVNSEQLVCFLSF